MNKREETRKMTTVLVRAKRLKVVPCTKTKVDGRNKIDGKIMSSVLNKLSLKCILSFN